jgi:hypothetical protein
VLLLLLALVAGKSLSAQRVGADHLCVGEQRFSWARSTRMRRVASAQAAKKWPRLSQRCACSLSTSVRVALFDGGQDAGDVAHACRG